MGFFKNIFKKKKGGTFFGNLIRGASNKISGGILGNGKQLAKQDAKFEQDEYDKRVRESLAYKQGASVASPLASRLENSPEVEDAKKTLTLAWFKKNWWMIVAPLVVIIGLTVWISKRKKSR